ncbi:MAG: polyprenyl synthetase family protein [Pseudomonadota bacterium]
MEALQQALQDVSESLTEKMDALLPQEGEDENCNTVIAFKASDNDKFSASSINSGEDTLIKAMRYSALSGGKRLRPFLTVACANLFGVGRETSLYTAAAIEFIHTYSLIHDDLPAMDDDDMRRGKPSCHIAFGEAAAILAGDALLTFAFQILADERVHADPAVRCELIRTLAVASGYRGMAGGQMMDLESENKQLSIDEIIRLQRLKTGELFAMSCEAGAILGKAARIPRNALRGYAHDLGLAFQITDDLLDAEGTRSEVGKAVKKDSQAGKATLISVLGVERAREQARILADQAIRHLDMFDKKADELRNLAEFVISRKS